MLIPLCVGLVGPDGRDLPLTLADGETRRARHPRSAQVRRKSSCSRTSPSRRCRRSTAVSRRRCASSPTSRRRSALPRRARQRSVQPLAGGADAGDAAAGRQRRGDPRRRRRAARTTACSRRSPRSSPTARSSLPSSRWCSPCRARPTSRARSPATSIPMRSSPRGWRCATPSASISRDALPRRYERLADTEPYRPDAEGAGRRALRNACLDLLVAARRAAARLRAPRGNTRAPTT